MAEITLQMLREVQACQKQVQLFKQTFGDSVELTEELAQKHFGLFQVPWAAAVFLTFENWKIFEIQRVAAQAKYNTTILAAETDEGFLDAAIGPAWKEQQIAEGLAFIRLYNAQKKG
jgi:hypothetical protein